MSSKNSTGNALPKPQAPAKAVEPTPNPAKAETVQPTEKTLTIDEILLKTANINALNEDRKKLTSHLSRIKAMKFGNMEGNDTITLENDDDSYTITNSTLCRKIADLMTFEIENKLGEINESIKLAAA